MILVAVGVLKIISFICSKSKTEALERRLLGHREGVPIFEMVKMKSD